MLTKALLANKTDSPTEYLIDHFIAFFPSVGAGSLCFHTFFVLYIRGEGHPIATGYLQLVAKVEKPF